MTIEKRTMKERSMKKRSMEGQSIEERTRQECAIEEYNTKWELSLLESRGYRRGILAGSGAFARVYRVWDERGERFAACKVSGQRELLRREGEVLRRINHPLFAEFIDYFEEGEASVLVQEYVAGSTLEELLYRRGGMSYRQALHLATVLAEGLLALHEGREPMIYRDVKPENILIREDGIVKLVDLGCAGPPGDRAVAGSRGYAAPEQMLGQCPCGTWSDVYGLGRTLEKVYPGRAPRGWSRLLERCVRAEEMERIPDMRYLLAVLTRLEKGGGRWLPLFFRRSLPGDELEKYRYVKNICLI